MNQIERSDNHPVTGLLLQGVELPEYLEPDMSKSDPNFILETDYKHHGLQFVAMLRTLSASLRRLLE